MDGYLRRRRDDMQLLVRHAHMNAVLSRVSKMPKVEELLSFKSHEKNQTAPAGEVLAAWGERIMKRQEGV